MHDVWEKKGSAPDGMRARVGGWEVDVTGRATTSGSMARGEMGGQAWGSVRCVQEGGPI